MIQYPSNFISPCFLQCINFKIYILSIKKIITLVSVVLIAALLIYGIKLYGDIFSKNTKFSENELYVHIPTDSNYEDVKKIIKISKKKLLIKYDTKQPNININIGLNCNYAKKKLNWFPKISIEEGLSKTYLWYVNSLK